MANVGPDGRFQRTAAWRWKENEGSWTGIWTRRGDSNDYDAVWTNIEGKRDKVSEVRATLSMSIRGDAITIVRRQSDGSGTCDYRGTLRGSQASGTYSCQWAPCPYEQRADIQ